MISIKPLLASTRIFWMAAVWFQFVLSVFGAQGPELSDFANVAIDEDTRTPTLFFTIRDPDTAANQLQLTRQSFNTNLVRLQDIDLGGSGNERTMRITPIPNAFGTAVIGLRVSDGQQEVTKTFTLTVRSVNDLPDMGFLLDRTIDEDTSTIEISFLVSDLETSTANLTLSGKSDVASLVPESGIVFGGQGANRTLVITPAPNQNGVATITITVNDGQDAFTRTFRLRVNPVNDGAIITTALPDIAIDEDTTSPPIAVSFSDIDTPTLGVTVAVSTSDGVLLPEDRITLTGTGNSRSLTITPRENRSGTATITVRVSDGGFNPASKSFLVTVKPVDDPPTMTVINDAVTNEDESKSVNFVVDDIDNVLANVLVTAVSDNPALLPNSGIKGGDALGSLRILTLTPTPNAHGSAKVTVTANDQAGGTVTRSFALIVAPIEDPPEISQISDQIADEDTVIGPLAFAVTDLDTPNSRLTITKSSSLTTLLPNEGILIQGDDSRRTVTLIPTANQSGTVFVELTVGDGTFQRQIRFRVTYNPVNDRPIVSRIDDLTIPRNSKGVAIPFTVQDAETSGNSLVLSRKSFNTNLITLNGLVFSGSGSNRVLTIVPVANAAGKTAVEIGVTDAGGAVAIARFSVTIPSGDSPLRIVRDPAAVSAREGGDVTLEVEAVGDGSIEYQWRLNGKNIPGATSSKLQLSKILKGVEGDYDVVVRLFGAELISKLARVNVVQLDYGDAPGYAQVAQRFLNGYGLGTGATAESASPVTDSLDDGTTFPTLTAGESASLIVRATAPIVAGQAAGVLNLWIDYNKNGVFGDVAEEWAGRNLSLVVGNNAVSVAVPITASVGMTWARLRFAQESARRPDGTDESLAGEIEDYSVQIQGSTSTKQCIDCDFGDAPASYWTTLAAGGPYHVTEANKPNRPFVGLGPLVDVEPDGVPGNQANSDDLTDTNPAAPANQDDEDGIQFPNPLIPGQYNTVVVVARTFAIEFLFLNAWIDFDNDGSFSQPTDRIVTGLLINPGVNIALQRQFT